MASPLAARLSRFLVRCYPPRWRQRYAAELLEVLDQHQPTVWTVLNLFAVAVSTRLDPVWRIERHPLAALRRWAPPVLAAVGAVLLLPALFFGYGAWKETYGPPMPISGGLYGLAFSPDEHTVALIGAGLQVWDVADPARITRAAVLTGQPRGVSAVAFSPDGKLLASGSDGGTVVLRSIADPAAPVITATLHFTIAPPRFPGMATGPDVALAFSRDGRTLTTIADNTTVTLWDVTDPGAVSRITTVAGAGIGAGEVAFSPGGRIVAGAPAAGDTLAVWTLP